MSGEDLKLEDGVEVYGKSVTGDSTLEGSRFLETSQEFNDYVKTCESDLPNCH